jgi:hypothetical protein
VIEFTISGMARTGRLCATDGSKSGSTSIAGGSNGESSKNQETGFDRCQHALQTVIGATSFDGARGKEQDPCALVKAQPDRECRPLPVLPGDRLQPRRL